MNPRARRRLSEALRVYPVTAAYTVMILTYIAVLVTYLTVRLIP